VTLLNSHTTSSFPSLAAGITLQPVHSDFGGLFAVPIRDNTDIYIGLTPTLTTVDYRPEEVGRCMAEQLLALIEGKVSPVQKAIRPFLVERESHGPNGTPTCRVILPQKSSSSSSSSSIRRMGWWA
jgi:hypothetical protein